ncbi:MAG TPA: DMT family transporter [Candidatus Dormibacteraeota bacterium]|nr:DMT family transporter [Candidatus Dormibacteraeota bacterium]
MTRRGWVLFGAMCLIWGVPYLLIKVAVRHIAPADLVFARTGIGTVLLLPIAVVRGQIRPLLPRWRPLLIYSLVEIAVAWFLLSEAETKISSSLSGLLVTAVPLVGVVLLRLTGSKDRLSGSRLLGLFVGVVGVAVVVGLDLGRVTAVSMLEMGIVVCCYAIGPQILARRLADLPSLGVVSASLAICAVLYAPAAVLQRPAHPPSLSVLAAVIALGVVCTALAFLIFFALVAEVGPVRATVITYVNPAVAVGLGVAFLHEPFTLGIGLGFALVLVGSILATRSSGQGQRAP